VSKREDKRTTYRVETFSFVRKKKGSFLFVGTLDQKKIFDDESREFSEILSEGALLLSRFLSIVTFYVRRSLRRRSRRRRRANLYPLVSSRNYRTERSFFLKSISEERERETERGEFI
jgi:hypothetical protein